MRIGGECAGKIGTRLVGCAQRAIDHPGMKQQSGVVRPESERLFDSLCGILELSILIQCPGIQVVAVDVFACGERCLGLLHCLIEVLQSRLVGC